MPLKFSRFFLLKSGFLTLIPKYSCFSQSPLQNEPLYTEKNLFIYINFIVLYLPIIYKTEKMTVSSEAQRIQELNDEQ